MPWIARRDNSTPCNAPDTGYSSKTETILIRCYNKTRYILGNRQVELVGDRNVLKNS